MSFSVGSFGYSDEAAESGGGLAKSIEAGGSTGPSLLEITELLRKQLDLPTDASAATVVQSACKELEVPTQGLTLLGKARACWEQMGAPDVQLGLQKHVFCDRHPPPCLKDYR